MECGWSGGAGCESQQTYCRGEERPLTSRTSGRRHQRSLFGRRLGAVWCNVSSVSAVDYSRDEGEHERPRPHVYLRTAIRLGNVSSHGRSDAKSSGGTTHVKCHYRKDGTYLHPYDRIASGSAPPYPGAVGREFRSYHALLRRTGLARQVQAEQGCQGRIHAPASLPFDGKDVGALPRLRGRPHPAAQARRRRRPEQHAVADDERGEGEG